MKVDELFASRLARAYLDRQLHRRTHSDAVQDIRHIKEALNLPNRELDACYILRKQRQEYYAAVRRLQARAEIIDRNLHDLYFVYPKDMLDKIIDIIETTRWQFRLLLSTQHRSIFILPLDTVKQYTIGLMNAELIALAVEDFDTAIYTKFRKQKVNHLYDVFSDALYRFLCALGISKLPFALSSPVPSRAESTFIPARTSLRSLLTRTPLQCPQTIHHSPNLIPHRLPFYLVTYPILRRLMLPAIVPSAPNHSMDKPTHVIASGVGMSTTLDASILRRNIVPTSPILSRHHLTPSCLFQMTNMTPTPDLAAATIGVCTVLTAMSCQTIPPWSTWRRTNLNRTLLLVMICHSPISSQYPGCNSGGRW